MRSQTILGVVVGVVFAGLLGSEATAQSGGHYRLRSNTIDGGGVNESTGGSFTLSGTIGQPDASVLEGGTYTLRGGFWSAGQLHVLPALSRAAVEALVVVLGLVCATRLTRRSRH